jgi:hypothetical protein
LNLSVFRVCGFKVEQRGSFLAARVQNRRRLLARPICRSPGSALHPSRAAKTHGHFSVLDDDGNRTAAVAEAEHPLEPDRIFLDVDVFDLDMPPLVLITGGLCVGSSILPEDIHHLPILLRLRKRLAHHNACTAEVT